MICKLYFSFIELNLLFAEAVPNVDIIFDGSNFQYPKLPAIHDYASEDDVSAFFRRK